MHHVLHVHSALGKRDTFDLPLEPIREVLDSLQVLLDGAAENVHLAHEVGMHRRIKAIVDDMNRLTTTVPDVTMATVSIPVTVPIAASIQNTARTSPAIDDTIPGSHAASIDSSSDADDDEKEDGTPSPSAAHVAQNDPQDYAAFIDECLDIVPGAHTTIVDLRARHMLWCRSSSMHAGLLEHFTQHHGYKRSDVEYDNATGMSSIVVRGFSMRPLPVTALSSSVDGILRADAGGS